MFTPSDPVHERLGSALHRLASLERFAETGAGRRSEKLSSEIRHINTDLERALVELNDALSSHQKLRSTNAVAERRAMFVFEHSMTPCFVLDRSGVILDANPAAVAAVNTSLRHLVGKSFFVFVGSDRPSFITRLGTLDPSGTADRWTFLLRPRERRGRQLVIAATVDSSDNVVAVLLPADGEEPSAPPAA